jgi:feruloyl esterase
MMDFTWNMQHLLRGPDFFIPSGKLALITNAVVAACDASDGLVDGIVSAPQTCNFNLNSLLCTGADTSACLTPSQLDTARAIYAGPSTSAGQSLYPGPWLGSEPSWASWFTGQSAPTLTNGRFDFPPGAAPLGATIAATYMKYLFFPTADANRDYLSFNFDTDPASRFFMGDTQNAPADLEVLRSNGVKLIIYNGMADPVVPPARTIKWWNDAAASLGGQSSLAETARLYLIPGMGHCLGSGVPSEMGANFQSTEPSSYDSTNDIITQLDTWVTQGTVPTRLNARDVDANGTVLRSRPLCPYPQVAKYKGSGDVNDAGNFACTAP